MEDTSGSNHVAGLSASSDTNRYESSTSYSSYSSRRQSGLSQDYLQRETGQGESDRQQSVSALKEKIAKMKQVINSAARSEEQHV